MKALCTFFLLVISFPGFCQHNPFDTLQFDTVMMYSFNEKNDEVLIVDRDGKLHPSVVNRVTLPQNSVQQLNERLGSSASYTGIGGLCFFPHLGLVYYRAEKIVASVTICMACHRLRSSIRIPAQRVKIEERGEVVEVTGAISDSLHAYLVDLVNAYKL